MLEFWRFFCWKIIHFNSVCGSDLVEVEKTFVVFQVHLSGVEVKQSLAERCRLGLLEVLHHGRLAGSDAVAPLVPVFHSVLQGDTGTGCEQHPPW